MDVETSEDQVVGVSYAARQKQGREAELVDHHLEGLGASTLFSQPFLALGLSE